MWQIKHSPDLVRDPVGAERDMAGERGDSIANMGPKSSAQDQRQEKGEVGDTR